MKQGFQKKSILALLLVLVLALGVLPSTAFATTGYSVSFDAGSGSQSGNTLVDLRTQTITGGGTAIRPIPDPTRSGYSFDGWYESGTGRAYSFSEPVWSSVSLVARWTRNSNYYDSDYYRYRDEIRNYYGEDYVRYDDSRYYSSGYRSGSYYYDDAEYYYDRYGHYPWQDRPPASNEDKRVLYNYSVETVSSTSSNGSSSIKVSVPDANIMGLSKVSIQEASDASSLTKIKKTQDYTRKKNGSVLTLKASYLSTLKKGNYIARLDFVGGHVASFEFTIE